MTIADAITVAELDSYKTRLPYGDLVEKFDAETRMLEGPVWLDDMCVMVYGQQDSRPGPEIVLVLTTRLMGRTYRMQIDSMKNMTPRGVMRYCAAFGRRVRYEVETTRRLRG